MVQQYNHTTIMNTERKQLNELEQFLAELHDEQLFEIFTALEIKGNAQLKLFPTSVPTLDPDIIAKYNFRKHGIWFTPNSMKNGKRLKANAIRFNAIVLDMDFKGTDEEITAQKAEKLDMLLNLQLIPTVIVETRNGFHLYWILAKNAILDIETYESLQILMQQKLDTDPGSLGAEHLFRVPGYNHWKVQDDPFMCQIIHADYTKRYTYDELVHKYGGKKKLEHLKRKSVIHKISGISQSDIKPHNMDLMFSKCSKLAQLESSHDPGIFENTAGHVARLFLASQMIPFGNKGRDKVHEILSQANDYDASITDYQLDSINGPPQTCEIMCRNQKCANICKADGKSPIKFGYMDDLFVFLEKQTSSFAYLDRRDEQLYFVDSEKKLDIILADADQSPSKKPVLKVIFNPSKDLTVDKTGKTINLFKPTDYMVGEKTGRAINLGNYVPSINHLLSNLIPVSTERDRFVNWLAGIMQTRSKQLTAWVFMGQPGAGKNVLLDHLLKPLFGDKQAIKVEDEQLKNPFNGWLQNAILIAFNEVAHDNRTRNSINSKVKAIITDNDIMINEKNVKVFTIDNHANALFFSNDSIPVLIEENDRRFNVVRTGGNMRKQGWFSDPERFFVDMKGELGMFAEYLINYNYDPTLAKTVISNGVKDALVDIGMTRYAEFSSHLKANDVDWFVESMDSLFPTSNLKVVGLNGWIEKDTALSAFREIYQDDRITKSKLTKELKLHGIRIGEIKGKKVYRWD